MTLELINSIDNFLLKNYLKRMLSVNQVWVRKPKICNYFGEEKLTEIISRPFLLYSVRGH